MDEEIIEEKSINEENLNVQLFSSDEDEARMFAVWQRMIAQTEIDLQAYFDDLYKSKTLGEVLYDLNLVPIWSAMERDLFVRVYWQILTAQEKNGTIESFIQLINAIYKGNCIIEVDRENPLHVLIHVTVTARYTRRWRVRPTGDNIITHAGDYIVFKQFIKDVTEKELMDILQSITNYGMVAEFVVDEGVI